MFLRDIKVDIDYKMVLARLGFKNYGKFSDRKDMQLNNMPRGIAAKGAKISFDLTPSFLNKLQNMTLEALTVIEPQASFLSAKFEIEGDDIVIPEFGFKFTSRNVKKILERKELIYLMVCTLGGELEKMSESLSEKAVSDAFILDAIGSETVEVLANNVNDIIRADARTKGAPILSMRFSPGYGDLSISVQPDFLRVLEADKIGVRLHKSGLMQPQKTISALIGAGKK